MNGSREEDPSLPINGDSFVIIGHRSNHRNKQRTDQDRRQYHIHGHRKLVEGRNCSKKINEGVGEITPTKQSNAMSLVFLSSSLGCSIIPLLALFYYSVV